MAAGGTARQVRVAAFCLLTDGGGRVLLAHGDYKQKLWALPGGIVEVGESLEEGAARETREETGLAVDVGGLVAVADVDRVLCHVFTASVRSGDLRPEPGEIQEVAWVGPERFATIRDETFALAQAMVALAGGRLGVGRHDLTGPGGGHPVHVVAVP